MSFFRKILKNIKKFLRKKKKTFSPKLESDVKSELKQNKPSSPTEIETTTISEFAEISEEENLLSGSLKQSREKEQEQKSPDSSIDDSDPEIYLQKEELKEEIAGKEQLSKAGTVSNTYKPKRSKSPSFLLDTYIELKETVTENEDGFEDVEQVEIDLSDIPKKHEKLHRSIKTQNVEDKPIKDKKQKQIYVKSRPKVRFDLNSRKITIQFPVPSFLSHNEFESCIPIQCIMKVWDVNDNIKDYNIELIEDYCKVGNYPEKPIIKEIAPFKKIECNIHALKQKLVRNYKYSHPNQNYFIFLQKEKENPLIYNLNRFFKENETFWFLLRKYLSISTKPIAVFEDTEYPDYLLHNVSFRPNENEILIYDRDSEILANILKEPKIFFSFTKFNYVFDEFFFKEPLFSTDFNIRLEGSETLKNYPKLVHIQNSIIEGRDEQDDFYQSFKWVEGYNFEITPELLNNTIGNYQVDIEFYIDESYTKKLFEKSIRCFFRYCPIYIEDNDEIIYPLKNGHKDCDISIKPLNNQLISIDRSDIDFNLIEFQNGIRCNKFYGVIPADKDNFELTLKSSISKNRVKLKPYIPRLKWRLRNIKKFKNFTGLPINLNFDTDFSMKKKPVLEIRVISREDLTDIFLTIKERNYPLSIKDGKQFIYTFPLVAIIEDLNRIIRTEGNLRVYLGIKNRQLIVMQITGETGEFFDHTPPKPKRRMKIERSKKYTLNRNILTELKNKGYVKSQPKKVVAALISILSDELRIKKMELLNMIFSDYQLNFIVNHFLALSNFIPESGMTYGEFLDKLWSNPYEKMIEIIEYLEDKLKKN